MILVSAAEPPSLRALGPYSPLCEANGMDFLVTTAEGAFAGIQRKRVDDLVASIRGDRIARELGMAEGLDTAILVIEGDWQWDSIGRSKRCRGWTRAQLDGVLLSFQVEYGWKVMASTSLADTAALLRRMEAWFAKSSHGSLSRRPKPVKVWGEDGHRASLIHFGQGWGGMGPVTVGNLIDHNGGRLPLKLTMSEAELCEVKGIGPGRARKMVELIGD